MFEHFQLNVCHLQTTGRWREDDAIIYHRSWLILSKTFPPVWDNSNWRRNTRRQGTCFHYHSFSNFCSCFYVTYWNSENVFYFWSSSFLWSSSITSSRDPSSGSVSKFNLYYTTVYVGYHLISCLLFWQWGTDFLKSSDFCCVFLDWSWLDYQNQNSLTFCQILSR